MRRLPAGGGRGVWILAVVLMVAAAPYSSAAGFSARSFPVPISVERERVRSALLVEFEIERYDLPFDTFAGSKLDTFEAAFKEFMLALRAADATRLAALRPGDKPEQLREILDRFGGAFGTDNLGVTARVRVGEDQLFVWEWPGPKGPVRRGFTVEARAGGGPRVEFVTSGRPLETLIVDTLQQEALHPQAYAPVEARTRYHYVFPLQGRGQAVSHPVVLHFDGQPCDIELFPPDGATAGTPPGCAEGASGAALAAYRDAYGALKERDHQRFAEAYTEKSRDKLRAWIKGLKPAEFDAFHAATTRSRRVRFVLDADPVALAFYTAGTDKRLRYEYLVKDMSGRGYRLTNAHFEAFLDDLLASRALFETELESFQKNVLGTTNAK